MKKFFKSKGFAIFIDTAWYNNPIFGMVLGICSSLAVTTTVINALVMGVSVLVVIAISSTIISCIRGMIPDRVRIITFMLLIATMVIVVDFLLKIYLLEVSRALGPYVGLIITNCIIMGRAEAFALKQRPVYAFIDSCGAGVGYTLSITIVAVIREVLGNGTLFGLNVFGDEWYRWQLLAIPPGAFFILGFYVIGANFIQKKFPKKMVNQQTGTS